MILIIRLPYPRIGPFNQHLEEKMQSAKQCHSASRDFRNKEKLELLLALSPTMPRQHAKELLEICKLFIPEDSTLHYQILIGYIVNNKCAF
jgi:hypothetical protein